MNQHYTKDVIFFCTWIYKSQNSKNGHFEEFVDEETGEVVTLWIEDKPEEIVKAVKEATPEELQKLKEMRKAFKKIDNEWWAIKDELDGAKNELKSLKSELRESQYGMEDEIGQATSDEERDKLGNQYGEELENAQNKIRNTIYTITNIESLTKKKEAIQNKLDNASNELYEYEQQIGYHD